MGLYRELQKGLAELKEKDEARPLGPFLRAWKLRQQIAEALRTANTIKALALR